MNKKERIKKGRRITAVDIMIFLLLILCIAGIIVRIAFGNSSLFHKNEQKEYLVSYVVNGLSDKYHPYFTEGSVFSLESGETFGTLITDANLTNTTIRTEDADGRLVEKPATDDIKDFRGDILVKGTMTDSGFLLNSRTYIAPNMTLTVSSPNITVELLITDITVKAN